MIKQTIDVNGYWKVIVYYNVDYNFFDIISTILYKIGISNKMICSIYKTMSSNKAKAVTITKFSKQISIVLFNHHSTSADYLNSIVHECEHVKQAMLEYYNVNDSDEPPAYTIGYLVMQMYFVFKKII